MHTMWKTLLVLLGIIGGVGLVAFMAAAMFARVKVWRSREVVDQELADGGDVR